MKKKFVGTRFGIFVLNFRNWFALRSISFRNPEAACVIANSVLADKLISRLCVPGESFLDIGAHIGSIFSMVHYYDSSIRIFGIEADPQKAASLRVKFDYCKLFETAVGEDEKSLDFFVSIKDSGYNSLIPKDADVQKRIKVQCTRIDTLLSDESIDLIKIDIEGAELGALRGGKELIQKCRPVIMFESVLTETNPMGYSAQLLWKWLNDHDYLVFTPDRVAHDANELSLASFLDCHQYPRRTINYFAIPQEKRLEIRDRARRIIGVKFEVFS